MSKTTQWAKRLLRPMWRVWNNSTPLRLEALRQVFGFKVDRNQWDASNEQLWATHDSMMTWSWDEIRQGMPQYFHRLEFAVAKAEGHVLEIGAGIGNMTRWLSKSPRVAQITATDAFPEAVQCLERLALPKVTPLVMDCEAARFAEGTAFDTVIICEVLEHLYPDEEASLIQGIMPHVNEKTGYVISVPIGWMRSPYHVRAFSKKRFLQHLGKFYGLPQAVDYSAEYSQVAFGCLERLAGFRASRQLPARHPLTQPAATASR